MYALDLQKNALRSQVLAEEGQHAAALSLLEGLLARDDLSERDRRYIDALAEVLRATRKNAP